MDHAAGLFRPPKSAAIYTEERCYITEILNTPQSPEVSLAECRVKPGVTTQRHSLGVTERYIMQKGSGIMELEGENQFPVRPGDCVLIPPGCMQRIKNTGATPLVFLCLCVPRFEPEQYVNREGDDIAEIRDID